LERTIEGNDKLIWDLENQISAMERDLDTLQKDLLNFDRAN
jgi:hypothetical protein